MLIESPTRINIDKDEFKRESKTLELKLGALQRHYRENGTPIIILIAGASASGKGQVVARLVRGLDPRGFTLHTPTSTPGNLERYPYLWRFWNLLPANGRIGIFMDNWYSGLFHREKGFKSAGDRDDWCRRVNALERQLTDSGCRIFKFYLHISAKEQKKRLKRLAANKNTSWRVTADDLRMSDKFDHFLNTADGIINSTHTENAPWTVLPADNWRYAALVISRALAERLEQAQDAKASSLSASPEISILTPYPKLDDADLSNSLNRDEYDKVLDRLQDRLRDLHNILYRKRIPVAIAYEGWDAAGKGGNIKRLVRGLDPRGYKVIPIGAPVGDELTHHYLWRFWKNVPRSGHIAVFDRTWYGRVLVEKVESLCSPTECERAYTEIVEMEREWVESGIVLLKFWLQIDKEEQLRRFEERMNTPYKRWKITDDDWRNREKWDRYKEAVDIMLRRTHSKWAPWTIVESNCKLFARVKVLKTVIKAIEAGI